MPFNRQVLCALRKKSGKNLFEFSAALGLSYGGLYKYESGEREPKREWIEKIAISFGLPIETFYSKPEDCSDVSDTSQTLLDLSSRLHKVRFEKNCLEERVLELEKQVEHLLSIRELQTLYSDILRLEVPKTDKGKRLANLVRNTAKVGEISLDEIAETLKIEKSTLKRWLGFKKSKYACQLFAEKTVEAFTPDEAGIRLQCFDCENKANGGCDGHGNTASPKDFFTLIALLERNGVDDRSEQAKVLDESYGIELTAHQISEYLSREKNGKPIPPDIVNLQPYKRK